MTGAHDHGPAPTERASADGARWWLALLLVAAVALAYWPAFGAQFVSYDDDRYVTRNEVVQQGLTAEGVRWALTATHASNWHPLTWLSHMLDVELFGADAAGAHHATSVLLHAAAAALLFAFLARATGRRWPALLAAALWALHPLRVESVAWVAERKDVLSGSFAFLTLWLYVGWTRRGGALRYLAVLLAFAAGLAAKSMLVTLPCVLLLVDLWPLRRAAPLPRLVLEKLPLFALSAAVAWVTMDAQQASGATAMLAELPLRLRVENALAALAIYVRETFWPTGLACLHPHPALTSDDPGAALHVPALIGALLAAGGLALGLALWKRTRAPLVGWLWTLGTLVPVSGLVQVGYQAHADRYTYLPFVGFTLALVFGLAQTRRAGRAAALGALLVVLAGVLTFRQARVWHDSATLWTHCLAVTGERNFVAHNNLGRLAVDAGRLDDAEQHFRASTAAWAGAGPGDDESAVRFANLGTLLLMRGRTERALAPLERAARLDPGAVDVRANLGRALAEVGRDAEAVQHLRAAHAAAPQRLEVADLLAGVLATSRDDAVRDGAEAVRIARAVCQATGFRQAGALTTLAAAQAEAGRFERAVELQRQALAAAPDQRRALEPRLDAYLAGRPWRKSP